MLSIVTALQCEAKPLIDYYSLKLSPGPFPLWKNGSLQLIVSGVGKIASAAAVGHLSSNCYLNVGIAGAQSHEIGSSFLVNKITDQSTNKNLYPQFPHKPPIRTSSLLTMDLPTSEYPKEGLIDMEGFGFLHAAKIFTTLECIHSVKVVSDNEQNPMQKMKADQVTLLIEKQMGAILSVIEWLREIVAMLPQPVNVEPILKKAHFTTTQKYQLVTLLQKKRALIPDTPLPEVMNAKQFIHDLEKCFPLFT